MAVEQREAARGETVIHSDHGTQFTSWAFTESSHVRAGAIDGPHRRLQRQRADRSVVVTDADRAARHAPLDDACRARQRDLRGTARSSTTRPAPPRSRHADTNRVRTLDTNTTPVASTPVKAA